MNTMAYPGHTHLSSWKRTGQYHVFIFVFGILKFVTSMTLEKIDGRQYYLIKTDPGVIWSEASTHCMDNQGGHLAVLDTQMKITGIAEQIAHVDDFYEAWLGARPNVSSKAWQWVNGTTVPTGQGIFDESTESNGNCLTVQGQRYNIRYCRLRTPGYYCEFERPNVHCINRTSRSCVVMFNATEISWFEARMKCQNMDGDLASPPSTGTETFGEFKGTAFIGGYRMPWWWTNPDAEVKLYHWQSGNETYNSDSCLAITNTGWVPRNCNKTMQYIICENETLENEETSITPTSGSGSSSPKDPNQMMYIIIGSLVGGVVLLVIIVVVLVCCLKKARKKSEEIPDFQFHDVTSASSSSVNTATIGTQASSNYEYAAAAPIQLKPDPCGVQNYAYEEAEPAQTRKGRMPNVNPYASSSINSVIERGSQVMNEEPAGEKLSRGSALNGLKKRLALLMKREYQPSRDALPSAPTTLQKGPDVVPMTTMGIYEDIGPNLRSTGQAGEQEESSLGQTSGYQTASDITMYAEVNNLRKNDDLYIVDNQQYEHL